MPTLQIHRHYATEPSPTDSSSTPFEQLSPARQRKLITVALHLIALHNMLDEVETTILRIQPPRVGAPPLGH